MELLRTTVASLVGVVTVFCVMTILAISPYTRDPIFPAELCSDLVQSDIGQQHLPQPDADKVPTLAPPRIDALSTAVNSLHIPSFGQSVYVQIKTDRADIEVGWASGEFLGR